MEPASHVPRILVPLAHPATAPDLARAAGRIATALGGNLVLLHVVHTPEGAKTASDADALFALAEAALPDEARATRATRFDVRIGEAIRLAAFEEKADLVLVGWKGERGLRTLLRGSLRPLFEAPPANVALLRLDAPLFAGDATLPRRPESCASLGAWLASAVARANLEPIVALDLALASGPALTDSCLAGATVERISGSGAHAIDALLEHGRACDLIALVGARFAGDAVVGTTLLVGAARERGARGRPAWRKALDARLADGDPR